MNLKYLLLCWCIVNIATVFVKSGRRSSRKSSTIKFPWMGRTNPRTNRKVWKQLQTFTRNKNLFERLRRIDYRSVNQCPLSARKHDQYILNAASDLYQKLKKGYSKHIQKDADFCHKNREVTSGILEKERRIRRTIRERFGNNANFIHIGCTRKGVQRDGTLNMCHDCQYRLTLPNSFIDRIHSVHLCDSQPNNSQLDDFSCLMGEGTCREIELIRNLVRRNANSRRLEIVPFSISIGCSCEVRAGSLFAPFVL